MARAAVSGRVAKSGRAAVASRSASARPRLSWVAADNLAAGFTLTLPSYLAITCATTGRTSQQSIEAIVTGYGANAARARNAGFGVGLSGESSRTNLMPNSEAAASWNLFNSATATNINGHVAPDGATTADQLNWAAAPSGAANSVALTGINILATCSAWILAVSSTTQVDMFDGNAGGVPSPTKSINTSKFQRINKTGPSVHAAVINWAIGAATAIGAGSAWTWGFQVENAVAYPGSYIPTAGTSVARAADVLSIGTPATIAPGGWFDIQMVVGPNYAATETQADHNLLYFDANNRVFFRQSDQKMVFTLGGVSVASSALTFSREQALTVRATNTEATNQLVVSGATTGNGTTAGTAAGSGVSLPATVYLLGTSSGCDEGADLRRVDILR